MQTDQRPVVTQLSSALGWATPASQKTCLFPNPMPHHAHKPKVSLTSPQAWCPLHSPLSSLVLAPPTSPLPWENVSYPAKFQPDSHTPRGMKAQKIKIHLNSCLQRCIIKKVNLPLKIIKCIINIREKQKGIWEIYMVITTEINES